jgi:hypothetical protein
MVFPTTRPLQDELSKRGGVTAAMKAEATTA